MPDPAPRISLQLLGPLSLCLPHPGEASAVLAQPKRVALLAFLVLAGPGYHRRDRIVGLLWPESDQERARNSLRQALHGLRRSLGTEVILNRGVEEVGLAEGELACDALDFQAAVAAGRWEEALTHYRGELLPGFHLPAAPEFDEWLEGERLRLKGQALRAVRGMIEAREREGAYLAAAEWAARGMALSPTDESFAAERVRLLDLGGDGAGALAAFEEFHERLAREYELAPGPGLIAQVEAIRRRPAPAPAHRPAPIRPAPGAVIIPATPAARGSRRRGVALGIALALALAALVLLRWRIPSAGKMPGIDPRALAILPFRVSGADPSLGYLREGMIDLLSAKLTGEADGLRATDPSTVLNAWRRATGDTLEPDPAAARALARGMGAGRVLVGGIVGRASRLMLQAAVYDVTTGEVRARGVAEGPTDSLPELVDHLAAQLLAADAPGGAARLPRLAGTPLRAVRAYLEGEQAYRGGRYAEAFARYRDAIATDSSFGPAAIGLAAAGLWYPAAEAERQRGLRLAWAVRHTLGGADRALLVALAGPRYPGISTYRERLHAWEQALAADSGRADAWYEYGDILMHRGPLLGIVGSAALAERAFARAVTLDSSFAAPVGHLFDLGAARGDTALAVGAAALLLARDSASDVADYVRWRRAVLRRDPVLEAALRRRMPLMRVASLSRIVGHSQLDGLPLGDALLAARLLRSRPLAPGDQVEALAYDMELSLNRGRPAEAAADADALANRAAGEDAQLAAHLLNALYADGDSAAAARVAARFAPYLALPPPASGEPRALHLWKACAAAEWRAWHGDTSGVAAAIGELRRVDGTALPWWAPANQQLCASRLEAVVAVRLGRPEARARVAALDSATLTVPDVDVRDPSTLVASRLWRALGETGRALDAARRRQYHHRTGLPYLATRLAEEGELALALHDTAAARSAWEHYLVLRSDPAPERRAARDAIRMRLEALGPRREGGE